MSGAFEIPDEIGVALVGYRGTGKTTVGHTLAERLGRSFVDADLAVEGRLGRSIRSIFETDGEAFFRDWEAQVLAELTAQPAKKVLATGGGVILRTANRDALKRFGVVVWLKAEPSVLARRLRGSTGRPALTAAGTLAEIADVLAAREPLYREVADVVIDTDAKAPGKIALEIVIAVTEIARVTPWAKRRGN